MRLEDIDEFQGMTRRRATTCTSHRTAPHQSSLPIETHVIPCLRKMHLCHVQPAAVSGMWSLLTRKDEQAK